MRKIDYDSGFKKQILKNIEDVRKHIDDDDMNTKIQNYCKRYDLPYMFIKRKILFDNIFALYFAKDPSKQSFHQQCAANFIKEIPKVENFQVLPANGKNAVFVINGEIKLKEEAGQKQETKETKSIDFFWNVITQSGKEITFYAAHKYTDQEGGAQDNQYNDLKLFMKHGRQFKDDNVYFLAIGDGPFYLRSNTQGVKRIDAMNELYGNEHCKALTSNDIETFIEKIYAS